MSTEQNYSAQDNCANTSEQQRKLDQLEALLAQTDPSSDEGGKMEMEVLNSLSQWAKDSIALAQKSRFLASSEKREVDRTLSTQLEHWSRSLDLTMSSALLHPTPVEYANKSIVRWMETQAFFNLRMAWYELPPYPVPEHIKPDSCVTNHRLLRAFHDKMSPMIKKNDTLTCLVLDGADDCKKGDVVAVLHRDRAHRLRQYSFGRIKQIDADGIKLMYDNKEYKDDSIRIALANVLFVLKVESAQSLVK